MNLGQALRDVLASDGATVVYECRHCGRTLSEGDQECPVCEWAGVARYRIPGYARGAGPGAGGSRGRLRPLL